MQLINVPGRDAARIWHGRIYYHRYDVYINDFFYWNPSGLDTGIDNISVGHDLKFNYGFFREDTVDSKDLASHHDIQLSGFPPTPP
ncbi:carbohydrate porin [Pseudomonas sp. LjRoot263]|uniref:carbohydrate porin n=1 Tax=Pseudomonas sp. LjRoot263 TaxID=3342302 RepID=UPI003F509D1F